ncbi:MAG: aminodeoxychorismate synthase component I [Thermodesulfobacteriota bacterium]
MLRNRQNISSPQICIKDDVSGKWLQFKSVKRILRCDSAAEVEPLLLEVEALVARGWYAAGFVCYEAAEAFMELKEDQHTAELPLLWFALAQKVETLPSIDSCREWPKLPWRPECAYTRYRPALAQIKDAIARGETYQVNYTYGLHTEAGDDFNPWKFFCYLNHRQQGRYAAYMDIGSHVVCSASPELFYAVEGEQVFTRPMKGTTPRGKTAEVDARLADQLQRSEKNRAENLMIVDMLRNDMSHIAETGSVITKKLFSLERYPNVWQMTSTVTATQRRDVTLADQFRALFPCASITGAPKRKTMEWISRLEAQPRGVYTGAIGFLLPGGRRQFSVAIRTALYTRDTSQLRYGVGGGIVWDSECEDEWCESRSKASILPGMGDFSLLETLLWQPRTGFRNLKYHLQRLSASAEFFGVPVDIQLIRQQMIDAVAAQAQLRSLRVRCLVDFLGHLTCQIIPHARQPLTRPVRLSLAHKPINSEDIWLRHKTDQRQLYTDLLNGCAAEADDVLLYNERHEITETSIANVVIRKNGRWLTPPLSCGLLPGTMRQRLLDEGRIAEEVLFLDDLKSAEIFLINSLRGWRWAECMKMRAG